MLNRALNAVNGWLTRRGLRRYNHYPADKTAVIFVDVQRAFVSAGQPLAHSLAGLAQLARSKGFLVVHGSIAPGAGGALKTPAHRQIDDALSRHADAVAIADAVKPMPDEVVLPMRTTLSVFGSPEVDALIAKYGIEHIILAGPLGDWTLDSSLRDAAQRDLHTTVVSDCLAASTPAALELEVRYTMPRYAHLVIDLADLTRRTAT